MRKLTLFILLVFLFIIPVSAMEFTAPEAPNGAQTLMPEDTESFGEGLWYVIKSAIGALQPDVAEAFRICLSLIAAVILVSILQNFFGATKHIVELAGTVIVSLLLINTSNSLVTLGTQTVEELCEYGKLLLPVMTAAMAAQGRTTASAALYTGTAFFSSLLSTVISRLIVPMIYIYLCLCIAHRAIGEEILNRLRRLVKWGMTWTLKIILYVFTGYISITGVVSGTADAAAVKAAKLAISGFVPVVGGIISDASETILVSAGVMKSAAGVYGLLAIIAIWIGPFLRIGIQYLLIKATAAICSVFGTKQTAGIVEDFSGTMGFALAMTGAVCLLLLISVVCFMKGVS